MNSTLFNRVLPVKIFYAHNISMSDPLFKPPTKVLNEIFGFNNIPKPDKTVYLIMVSFIILFVCIFIFIYKNDLMNILIKLGTALYLNDSTRRQLLLDCIKKNIGILIGPALLGFILFYAIRDPKALTSNTSSYIIFIGTIMLLCFGLYSNLLDFSKTSYMSFIIGGIALLVISSAGYYSSYITTNFINTVSNFIRIIIILMLIVGLAIGYKMFSEKLKSLTGWPGFFANFLFYIPCMLSDGLEYLLQQYKITPNIVFILLIIEMLLMLLYLYVPKIIEKAAKKSAITLQNKPVYLDKEINIGKIDTFLFKPLNDKLIGVKNPELFRRNYCINMWVYLNIQPSSSLAYSKETTIFNYNNHPRITHKNESKNERLKNRNVYTFYFTNTQDGNSVSNTENIAKYEVNIPQQKWNMLSFNYFESKVDLYINGNLERTFNFSNNMPDYSSNDAVLLGSDDGVSGSICNITYNKKPLTSEQIATLYNTNYFKNPPIDLFE